MLLRRSLLAALLMAGVVAITPAVAKDKTPLPGGPTTTVDGSETSEVRGDLVEAFLNTLPGTFQVNGINPNGSRYSGTAQISFNYSTFMATVVWQVGADTYQGQGPLDAGRFVIDWGSDAPVIYTVTADLNLSGTWARGQASETLTPLP